jgi:hypothetical protein
MLVQIERHIRIDQAHWLAVHSIVRTEIQAFDVFYDRAAAKRVQEFALERALQPGIITSASLRQIYLDPCSLY